jgi:hypothetical protein
MRNQFVSRESKWDQGYHIDKYLGLDERGRPVSSFERQVPMRVGKTRKGRGA